MRAPSFYIFAIAIGSAALPATAVEATMTSGGFTGLGVTPTAHLLGWGRADATYDNQLPGIVRDPAGHNFVLGFGLLPNLEIAGRLAANELHSNCFTNGCGARDLSASIKAGIGLDAADRFRIAAGVTDVGGAVTYFRTYYGVLTYSEGSVEASAGLAHRTGRGINGSRSPLNGPFMSAAWQSASWVRGHLEYSDGDAWAGVRLYAPKEWLPEGWSLSAGANARLTQTNLTQRVWWTTSLSIPLYKVPSLPGTSKAPLPPLAEGQRPLPAYEARVLPPIEAASARVPSAPAAAVDGPVLQAAADALEARGLEDIWVGRMPDGSVAIRANNGRYSWNTLDALGVALGAIAQVLGDTATPYRFILTQRDIAIVSVTGQANCLRNWINAREGGCTANQLSTPGKGVLEVLHQDAKWAVRSQKPGWRTVRLNVSPVLRTNVGSEFGVLDYSIGVNVGAALPLWDGASAEWRVNVPVGNSSDYEPPRGVFANRRIRSGTERLALVQTMRVPLERWIGADEAQVKRWGLGAVTTQATIGRVGTFYDGVHAAVRWEPGEGLHRLTAQTGLMHNNEFNRGTGPLGSLRRGAPLLASYRYSLMPTKTYLEATAGQFLSNDRGFLLGMRQWFGDVSVHTYYKRTAFAGSPVRQFAGIELSAPIGPRRDYAVLPNVQAGGTPRFNHGVETTVRTGVNSNPVRLGYGTLPPVPTLDAVFNADRGALQYFEDNIRRIRDAAR